MEENIAALNTQRYDVPYPVLEVPGIIIGNDVWLLETKQATKRDNENYFLFANIYL